MDVDTRIEKFSDPADLAQAAADHFASIIGAAVRRRGRASVALSGGSTPKAAYRSLTTAPLADSIKWNRLHVFWGDERCVPPDHPDSNYRMANDVLLSQVPLPPENIHRMRGEEDPHAAAEEYEKMLCGFFGGADAHFDLVLLGLGEDGHTASLFPSSEAVLREVQGLQKRWVTANYVNQLADWRVTLSTIPINAAAHIIFLVTGSHKAKALKRVLRGPYLPEELPAQLIRPQKGLLLWMVDESAARLI